MKKTNDSEDQSNPEQAFRCDICKDGGFVHPLNSEGKVDFTQIVRCICKQEEDREQKKQAMVRNSHLPPGSENKNFGTFLTYNEEDLVIALRLAKAISEGSEDIRFLTLVGLSDIGKTHLSLAACWRSIELGKSVRYAKTAKMLDDLRSGYDDDSYHGKMNFLNNVEFLILDDFGTERITEWGAEHLQEIIDYRYDWKLHTMITTNREIDDLFNYHDHPREKWRDLANMRISSRLQRESWCRVLAVISQEHMDRK